MSTAFENDLQQHLSPDHILSTDQAGEYRTNIGGYSRELAGVIKAKSIEEIQLVVQAAERHSVSLYPISQGKNWGLGSKLPVSPESYVLDLSGMNRIIEIHPELGYAVIEPGVTQKQLADRLLEIDAPFYLDVTGSGQDTSILGNALERGVAYNSCRADNVTRLQAVISEGRIIETGFGGLTTPSQANHVYKYGLGPSLNGLFFESNFGIVTQATVLLTPKKQCQTSFNVYIRNAADVPAVVTAFRSLLHKKVLDCIPHIFNKERFLPGLAPLVEMQWRKAGISCTREDVTQFIDKQVKGQWLAMGAIGGTPDQLRVAKKEMRRSLKQYGQIRFIDDRMVQMAKPILKIFGQKKLLNFLEGVSRVRQIPIGRPTNDTLYSTQWPIVKDHKDWNVDNIDQGVAGFLFCVPIIPLTEADVSSILRVLREEGEKFSFIPAVTVNPAGSRFAEVVVSIEFDRSDEEQTQRAHQCITALNEAIFTNGYPPCRLAINQMQHLKYKKDYREVLEGIKRTLDPKGIFAPGRYL